MKRVELLSPVGNWDMLESAVNNGADAVYLAGIKYGARAYADNFDEDKLVKAIKYCHLYGVRIYITVNTLIYESEVDDFIKYVGFLYSNGVDAVIMQDVGMISMVRDIYPNLEIHASTQCHNHNKEGIQLFKDLGVTRVVMAREMSLEEINSVDIDIEKEVFVYGALCVSYSGCCLFSSMNGGRSGNRGECVGSCRLPYKLIRNNKVIETDGNYLLSMRDLNTINNISDLLDSKIDSLKIEGRMKSSYYVGYVTRIYRRLIDNYYSNKEVKLDNEEDINLRKLFNREFTRGYLFKDKDIINIKSPNHQGVMIGNVIKVSKKYIYIKLSSDNLYREDGIRFKDSNKGMIVNRLYNDKLLLVNSINKGDIAVIDNKFRVKEGDMVLKTVDKNLTDYIDNYPVKRIGVNFEVKAYVGKRLEVGISDKDDNRVVEYGDMLEESINHSVSSDNIIKCLSKLGNSPFKVMGIDINKDDNIFVSLGGINEVRRRLVSKLIDIRENKKRDVIVKNSNVSSYNYSDDKYYLSVLVRNEEQLKCCLDNEVDYIYVSDYELYMKYNKYNNIYYRVDRASNRYKSFSNCNLLVSDLGGVYKYKGDNNIVSDYYLNVTNSSSIGFLNSNNVKRVTLSVELSDVEISNIMKNRYNVEVIIYGRVELMVMKYCILKNVLNYCNKCNGKDKFYLEDRFGNRYPINRDKCVNYIMHYKNTDKIDNIGKYMNMGINCYRLELYDEGYRECKGLIDRVRNNFS